MRPLFNGIHIRSLGFWLQRNSKLIQKIQWILVVLYLFLLVIPAFLELPARTATILNNLVLFSQFVFWGIWWPFVILSMLLFGRFWCGIFCPEGALSEWTSLKFGQNRGIPKWMKWPGWSTISFILTTLYGQLISVYDYSKAALLVLGGSTIAAILVGFLYGKGTRIWCRHLCPVNGVFNLLSRLSPVSFYSNLMCWDSYKGNKLPAPKCPPMINLHHLDGVSGCHMCGQCAGYRDAIALKFRSQNEEILKYRTANKNIKKALWESYLLVFGMIGVALGAFTWTSNPWLVDIKLYLASWLVNHNVFWPLEPTAPWWILTHYPKNNDTFNWLDGFCIGAYILGCGLLIGGFLNLLFLIIDRLFLQNNKLRIHLVQGLIPLAAAGLFIGLTSTSFKLLDYKNVYLIHSFRLFIFLGAGLWSCYLGLKILYKNLRPVASVFKRQPHTVFYYTKNSKESQQLVVPDITTNFSKRRNSFYLSVGAFLYCLSPLSVLACWYFMFLNQ